MFHTLRTASISMRSDTSVQIEIMADKEKDKCDIKVFFGNKKVSIMELKHLTGHIDANRRRQCLSSVTTRDLEPRTTNYGDVYTRKGLNNLWDCSREELFDLRTVSNTTNVADQRCKNIAKLKKNIQGICNVYVSY